MLNNLESYQLNSQPTMVHQITGAHLKISHFKYMFKGDIQPRTSLFLFYNDSATGNFEMVAFTSAVDAAKYVKERRYDT